MEVKEYLTMFNAEDRHWWYVTLHELILRCLPAGRNDLRIFDAGCGTGRLLQLLQSRGSASGCDQSIAAILLCGKRGVRQRVTRCDLNELILPQGAFDAITSIDVLYHRDVKDDRGVLSRLHRALAPNGVLILQVPAYEWLRSEHDRAVHTGRRYTKTAVVTMLEDCGYAVERATYRVFLLFLPVVLWRFGRKVFAGCRPRRQRPTASDVALPDIRINRILAGVQRLENSLIERISLPFGTSIFVVARKTPRSRQAG